MPKNVPGRWERCDPRRQEHLACYVHSIDEPCYQICADCTCQQAPAFRRDGSRRRRGRGTVMWPTEKISEHCTGWICYRKKNPNIGG